MKIALAIFWIAAAAPNLAAQAWKLPNALAFTPALHSQLPGIAAAPPYYNCRRMSAMRCAEQFPGADCGAKIKAADASFAHPKGIILVSRKCGMTISTSIAPQHSIWFTEGGTWKVTAPIQIVHGGISIIGLGMNDSITNPGTQLEWHGPAGQDMVAILGAANARLDRVVFQDLILDGLNVARYTMRAEKIDVAELHRVRLRNGAIASFYAADSTGWKWYDVQLTQCPSYCAVLDWGTGGFYWVGGTIDILKPNTAPGVLIQGATNAVHIQGIEADASATGTYAGFIQVTGFDVNSSFPGAPPGGAGAPAMVTITDSSFFQYASAPAPSQGADILVTGTAAHPSIKVMLVRDYFTGANVSPAAVKLDFTTNIRLVDLYSNGHTASTLVFTSNAAFIGEEFVSTLNDPARCSGACGNQLDMVQNPVGQLSLSNSLMVGSYVSTGSPHAAASGVVRLAAGDTACWRNAGNSADICISKTTDDTLQSDFRLASFSFSGLGSPANGTIRYCADCAGSNPCSGGGTGAVAKRINGIWVCN